MTALRVLNRPNKVLLNQLYDEFYKPIQEFTTSSAAAADIFELDDLFLVLLDAPGFKKSEIEINYVDGILSIEGKREAKKEFDVQKIHLLERNTKGFKRSFVLKKIDEKQIRAKFEEGVLSIELPKAEEAKPRKISIADNNTED